MLIGKINPALLLPIDPPTKPKSIASLIKFYESRPSEEKIEVTLPYVFIHRVKKTDEIYIVDGHHRSGVAHLYGRDVHIISLNSYADLVNAMALADMGLIPKFDMQPNIISNIHKFNKILPHQRENVMSRGIRNMDDYVACIRQNKYVNLRPSFRP